MRPLINNIPVAKAELDENEKLFIKLSIEGINQRYADIPEEKIPHETLLKRAEYELNTIISMGFTDYFLIVSDYLKIGGWLGHMPSDRLEYLRAHMGEMDIQEMVEYIKADQSAPGMAVGLGRGSAAGSVIAYALQITNLEPITYNLLFERFLNPERVSMPDIDSDFANAKALYGTRDIVIEYVSKKYGKDAICSIVTKDTLAAKAAIDNVTRVVMSKFAQEHSQDINDELKNKFYGLAREMKALIPEEPGISFDSKVDETSTVADIIQREFADNKDALEILEYAKQLEDVNINYGKHAAGVVIADNGDVGAYGALMYDEDISGWKIQMDGPDVEGIGGLLKMDFLGLTTLNIITATVRYIQQNTGVYVDCDNIPDEPEVYSEIFAKANTFGVFQFESAGARKILKNFKPDCFEDLIIINAINRPGPAQYIGPITAKKHGEKVEETAFDKVECIQDILSSTYGYPVYQEQVMQIFQKMGQYSMGGADEIRRAMSKKKQYIIDENREIFVHGGNLENHDTHKSTPVAGAASIGIDEQIAYNVYDSIQDFAKYGFNKSHAAVYAKTAYITAWLKYHYPTEFFTAYVNISQKGPEDFQEALADARRNGVNILPPDINESENIFTCSNGQMRFGFSKLSLEAKMKNEFHDYRSMADFILRTSLSEKAVKILIDSGALDRFSSSRAALNKVLPLYFEYKKDYIKADEKLANYELLYSDMEAGCVGDKSKYGMQNRKTLPSKNQVITTIESAKADKNEAENLIKSQVVPAKQFPDDLKTKLNLEKDILKAYVSGHPLDIYGSPVKYNCMPLESIQQGEVDVMGMITNVRICRKKDDPTQQMAFFTLEDKTGSIPVCVFTKAYEKYGSEVFENRIVKLKGYVKLDKKSNDGTLQFVVDPKYSQGIIPLDAAPCDTRMTIGGIEELNEKLSVLSSYSDLKGHPVEVLDLTTGDCLKLEMCVSDQAVSLGLVKKI